MISLTCTNCRAVLEMDDGFAGGVCRCQHCGTIQTVPSKLKDRNGKSKAHASKTLYAKVARGEAIPSSGLDQLAQVVASSGLASERQRAESLTAAIKPSNLRLVLLTCAGAMLGMGITIGAWVAFKGQSTGIRQAGPSAPGQVLRQSSNVAPNIEISPARIVSPNFCEIALHERTIIYVLDRGNSMRDLLSYLKAVTYLSIETLGSDRKFQIIFWNNGSDEAHPQTPTFALPHTIETARRSLDSVIAHGQTDVGSAMKLAVASNPDAIILATAKGWQLDDTFVDQVMNIRAGKSIKIHAITLGGAEQSEILRSIAKRSGGESRLVTEGELKRYAAGQ
jgi:von Willebrand factor type A domain